MKKGEIMKVLIVDDNPSIRGLNSRILENLGCGVTESENGHHALALLEDENPFDVIFVDFRLPYVNGLELLIQIKSRYADAVVYLISAAPSPDLEVKARQNGAKGCILGYGGRERFQEALRAAQTGQSYGFNFAGR
jgi:CheY-like chemotaxis protein